MINRLTMRCLKDFISIIVIFCIFISEIFSQSGVLKDNYLQIDAKGDDPLYTTYAAPMSRSRLYGDKAYKMDYFAGSLPVNYSSDQSGKFYLVWKFGQVVVDKIDEYYQKPVVRASFPDMVIMDYQPWPDIFVRETFVVYSSKVAFVDIVIKNQSNLDIPVEFYPVQDLDKDSIKISEFSNICSGYLTHRFETKKRLISNLYAKEPYPTDVTDIFATTFPIYSYGGYKGNLSDLFNKIKTDFYAPNRSDSLNLIADGLVSMVVLHGKINLKSGEEFHFRVLRGIQDVKENTDSLIYVINETKTIDIQMIIEKNVRLFSKIPRIDFQSKAEKLIYLSSFNLLRGSMLPPSGKTTQNFYVFSRNPLWGWGHGHQVLHESLSMMAYAWLDPISAQNSQRVYMEQQGEDGLIAYRHGPRGAQTYPHKDKPTTSAPFYSWINLEIYKVSKDRKFLDDAYHSGSKYVKWLFKNRDVDQDSTFEWGPYGIIENVRDWYNAVFQVSAERYLDVDKEDISDELECVDLTLMVIKEIRSLAEMATELNLPNEAENWMHHANKVSDLVNQRMWDEKSGFYYSINMKDHSWFYLTRDLRREEIIGFLALWAGVATPERAKRLIDKLTDPDKFWRKYGIPTLAADDEWYTPYVDYCCKWNGPVWLLWEYMVFDGLKNYGYNDLAIQLSEKMITSVSLQLCRNHNFWESYSADNEVLNCPSNYIWDGIMAKLIIEKYALINGKTGY